jgi:hypothetical protein
LKCGYRFAWISKTSLRKSSSGWKKRSKRGDGDSDGTKLDCFRIQEIKKRENERMSETVKIKERENGLKSKIKKLQAKHASQVKTNN